MSIETPSPEVAQAAQDAQTDDVTAESLIEEVSIDGMCGVY